MRVYHVVAVALQELAQVFDRTDCLFVFAKKTNRRNAGGVSFFQKCRPRNAKETYFVPALKQFSRDEKRLHFESAPRSGAARLENLQRSPRAKIKYRKEVEMQTSKLSFRRSKATEESVWVEPGSRFFASLRMTNRRRISVTGSNLTKP